MTTIIDYLRADHGERESGADPLFQTPVQERFAQLHSVIVREAGGTL